MYNQETIWWYNKLCNEQVNYMYDNIKSCIVYNNCKSDFFRCENGVRQGENLSNVFVFNFSKWFRILSAVKRCQWVDNIVWRNWKPVKCISETFRYTVHRQYSDNVDDTVIMSATKEDLQKQLNVFSEYCKYWQLKVNVEKNKIFVFSREASK